MTLLVDLSTSGDGNTFNLLPILDFREQIDLDLYFYKESSIRQSFLSGFVTSVS
jgi:hypothetical protein